MPDQVTPGRADRHDTGILIEALVDLKGDLLTAVASKLGGSGATWVGLVWVRVERGAGRAPGHAGGELLTVAAGTP